MRNVKTTKTTGIFKISSYGDFVKTFACLILARNYNSPRTVSVKVLTLPVAAEPTLRVIKHSQQVAKSDKNCTCLEERFCFASTWFCTDRSLPVSSRLLRGLFFLVIFAGIELKLEKVGPTFSSFNSCPSMPSVEKDDRKQFMVTRN